MLGLVKKFMEDLQPFAQRAIGGTVLVGVFAGTVYVVSAEPCQNRALGPFVNDRSGECPVKSENGGTAERTNSAPAPSPAFANSPRDAIEILPPRHEQDQLRSTHGLMLIEAEEETLKSMPRGTYAYVWGGTFATNWRDGHGQLTVRRSMRAEYFELQKRNDGHAYLIGFVRGDAAKSMAHAPGSPVEVDIYSHRFRDTDVVIAIPVAALKSVGQDEIQFPKDAIIPVLELRLDGA